MAPTKGRLIQLPSQQVVLSIQAGESAPELRQRKDRDPPAGDIDGNNKPWFKELWARD